MSAAKELSQEPLRYPEVVARLAAAQKSAKGAPAYSRFINRPLGRRFAAAGYLAGATPNQVTAISAVFTYAGIVLLALVAPTWWLGLLVAALLVIGYGLDAADGQLARLRGGGSLSGEWLDHMVDALKIAALHQVVAVALYRFTGLDRRLLLIPLLFAVVAVVSFFAMLLNDQLRRGVQARGGSVDPGRPNTVMALLKLPTDYGVLCLAFVLWGFPVIFLACYGVLAAGSLLYLLAASVKWYRDVAALDSVM